MIQVDYLVLADAVAAVGGKHYIHGGGWDTLTANAFPTVHPAMAAAVRLRIPWHDTNRPVEVGLDVLDADGQSILAMPPGPPRGTIRVGRPPELPEGDDQVLHLALPLNNLRFAEPGRYVVTFLVAGEAVARAPFRVNRAAPEPPTHARPAPAPRLAGHRLPRCSILGVLATKIAPVHRYSCEVSNVPLWAARRDDGSSEPLADVTMVPAP